MANSILDDLQTEILPKSENGFLTGNELALFLKMVRSGGVTSNTDDDELFEILQEWNELLKSEHINFEELSQ